MLYCVLLYDVCVVCVVHGACLCLLWLCVCVCLNVVVRFCL